MNSVDHFIRSLEHFARNDPARLAEFKSDIARDLHGFFAYIAELESPIDRPAVKDQLEAEDDASFNALLARYPGILRDTDLGNLRREASAIRREGLLGELFAKLEKPHAQEKEAI